MCYIRSSKISLSNGTRSKQRVKKDAPTSTIARLKKLLDKFEELGTNNALEVNLHLTKAMIEKFRHIIVHSGGRTANSESLVKDILQSAGLWNDGIPSPDNEKLIRYHLGTGELEAEVVLQDKLVGGIAYALLGATTPILSNLVEKLIAYAHIIYSDLQEA